ncbi:MAG: sigma-70 family RNA polymerase sigma factor [Sphingobium sp.]
MHRRELVNYANGIVRDRARAEDVVQDAWERIEAVERQRLLEEPLRYFYRIVRNLALDGHRIVRRDAMREVENGDDAVQAIPDEAPSPEQCAIARQQLQLVYESMKALPERTREALMLHALEGLKMREIAERMNISIGLAHKLVVQGKAFCAKRADRRP